MTKQDQVFIALVLMFILTFIAGFEGGAHWESARILRTVQQSLQQLQIKEN